MNSIDYKKYQIALVRGGYAVSWLALADSYDEAIKNAKSFGGRRYRGKDFGGGIAFDSECHAKDFIDKYSRN